MRTAEKLRKRRGELGLSQASVANRAGMSTVQYNGYERARHEPSEPTLNRLATALATTVSALLGDKEVSEETASVQALMETLRRRLARDANWNPERVRIIVQFE